MKIKMIRVILASLIFTLAGSAHGFTFVGSLYALDDSRVKISAYDTLYVKINDQTGVFSTDGYLSDIGEKDRFNHLSQSISSVIENKEIPVDLKFVRSGSDTPDGVTVLNIGLLSWRINRLGEFETRLSATLSSPGGKEKLGIFVGRYITIDFNPPATTIEHLKTSARRAAEKLIPELQFRTISSS